MAEVVHIVVERERVRQIHADAAVYRGGELVIEECGRVLRDEYSTLADIIHLALPDEKFRRVGQSAAAASLPENRK